jgi:hypothetical protein
VGSRFFNSKPYFTLVLVEWKYVVHTFIDVLFNNEIPMSPSEPKGALNFELGERMPILELGKRNSLTQLSKPTAEIDVKGKVFSCVMTTVKPRLIHLHESKLL